MHLKLSSGNGRPFCLSLNVTVPYMRQRILMSVLIDSFGPLLLASININSSMNR